MAHVTITINSREYAVSCEDGQELRIIQLANILDEKAKALTGGNTQVNEAMLLAMVGLVLADELTELKKNPSSNHAENPQTAIDEVSLRKSLDELDSKMAGQIKSMHDKLKTLASELNLL